MKRVLFINTHLGSGSTNLTTALTRNRKVQNFKGYAPFNHPDDLKKLTDKRHKCDNSAAIYMHHLYNNSEWVRKPVRRVSKFIHLIREPRATLSELEGNPKDLLNGYCLRLRGIYEMFLRTPGSFVFDVSKIDVEAICQMLDLEPFDYSPPTGKDEFPEDLCQIAEETYEKYLNLMPIGL